MADVFVSRLNWTGSEKGATRNPAAFSRDLEVTMGETSVAMSSAPAFRGDASRVNPEQLFVASLSACQALTYLYVAARNQLAVVAYEDEAEGHLEVVDGRMRIARVVLRPRITLDAGADIEKAGQLVQQAHGQCFIGNSVRTRVEIEPAFALAQAALSTGTTEG